MIELKVYYNRKFLRGHYKTFKGNLNDPPEMVYSSTKTSGKKSYREYGENSELEDFADSVGYYVTKHDEFAKLFPERTKLLDEILK